MKKIIWLVVALFMVCFAGAAGASAEGDGSVIQVDGYGAAPPALGNSPRGRMMARRAALVDAYRNVLEQIEGVNVDAETTVKDMMLSSDVVHTRVTGLVKGAKVISENPGSENGYRVTIQIPLYGAGSSVASAVIPQSTAAPVDFPAPSAIPSAPAPMAPIPAAPASPSVPVPSTPTVPVTMTATAGNYTGVIIDCRGMGLQRALCPAIKTTNNSWIYGNKNFSYDTMVRYGLVSYVNNPASSSRAGTNPIVVKALKADGQDVPVNAVISLDDANRILAENQTAHFLNRCAVVFVIDAND